MFDINELMNRANGAKEQASKQMEELMQSTENLLTGIEAEKAESLNHTEEIENAKLQAEMEMKAANLQKQKEVLTQMMGEEFAKQSAMMQQQVSEEVKKQVSEIAAMNSQELLGKLYGDDMAILSAALDTLGQLEETDGADGMEEELTPEQLYAFIEERMEHIGKMDELSPVPYTGNLEQWQHFAVFLSGILSTVNGHALDSLEVQEHIPVMDQQIANLVRNSWGITGREDLLDTLCYLMQDGYRARYERYAAAESYVELVDEDTDEDDKEGIQRGWTFVQQFKKKYPADFLLGWDIGRAAMITRWGYFLGWITQAEAWELLSDMAKTAAPRLSGWREFARSYLFGGAFWKEVCASNDAAHYLKALTEAVAVLLGHTQTENGGEWKKCPWPRVAEIKHNSH